MIECIIYIFGYVLFCMFIWFLGLLDIILVCIHSEMKKGVSSEEIVNMIQAKIYEWWVVY